ncbi:MAG: acyl-CoA dehydrogenase family protein [Acidobacteriota bacterium]
MSDWTIAFPSQPIDTPETLTDEHRAIGRTVDEFWTREVAPQLDAIRAHAPGVARAVVRKAGELGLTSMQIPEAYGGLDLDLPSVVVAVEHLSEDASYLGWHFAHSGIGTLPLVFYGTDEQKRRYLPRLATVELLGAYALTEPQAGSDARAATMRAELTADGRFYELTGQKMWITNGGEADLFTVFAQVDGNKLTAFLVERGFGVVSGAQEHKMGIVGTSTTALYFDRVRVPVENVLGAVGKGHLVAFNVLNFGRLKVGPIAIGGAKKILDVSIAYATTRRAFGASIATFGAVERMLADAAIRLYAVESATWHAVGLIERDTQTRLATPGASRSAAELAAFERHAAECSIIKIAASEMLDDVADIGVQIHGGYGYHVDYFVERAYRDARINRIFEGTNEINRVVIPSLVLKRAAADGVPLLEAARRRLDTLSALATSPPAETDDEVVERARTITQLMLAAAERRRGAGLRQHQEVTMGIADGMIELFVMTSCLARARQAPHSSAGDMASAYLHAALARIASAAEDVMSSVCEGNEARTATAAVRALAARAPRDLIALRARIAQRLVQEGRYTIG